jgi:hypothetical protein
MVAAGCYGHAGARYAPGCLLARQQQDAMLMAAAGCHAHGGSRMPWPWWRATVQAQRADSREESPVLEKARPLQARPGVQARPGYRLF